MIININSKNNNRELLNIRDLLSKIESPLYHASYELRHPLGIYNVAFSSIIDCFDKVTKLLLRVIYERPFLAISSKKGDRSLVKQLLIAQKDLLYGLIEYLDDCDNILLCFFPTTDARKKNPDVKVYKKLTDEFREHIGKITGYLKHNQGRIVDITFYNEKIVLPGYFIVGATGEDALGPSRIVHSGNTAFSFARDLRYNFFRFYEVSLHLSDVIIKIENKKVSNILIDNTFNEKVLNIASIISNLPSTFYQDEAIKPVPSVEVSRKQLLSDSVINLIYPDKTEKITTIPKGIRGVTSFTGDGVSKSFTVPYGIKK